MSDGTYNLNGDFKPTAKRFADLSGPDFFPTPPPASTELKWFTPGYKARFSQIS
jgi:hypothetical protein